MHGFRKSRAQDKAVWKVQSHGTSVFWCFGPLRPFFPWVLKPTSGPDLFSSWGCSRRQNDACLRWCTTRWGGSPRGWRRCHTDPQQVAGRRAGKAPYSQVWPSASGHWRRPILCWSGVWQYLARSGALNWPGPVSKRHSKKQDFSGYNSDHLAIRHITCQRHSCLEIYFVPTNALKLDRFCLIAPNWSRRGSYHPCDSTSSACHCR